MLARVFGVVFLPDLRGVRAVLFDMDGTLVDSEGRTDDAVRAVLAKAGGTIDDDGLRALHGLTWTAIGAKLVRRWPTLAGAPAPVVDELQERFHDSLRNDPPAVTPGARWALHAAADRVPIGIVTASNRNALETIGAQLGIAERLSLSVAAEDCPVPKPAPAPYLQAARALRVPPERCLVFEDSGAGLAAARASGATVIAIRRQLAPGGCEAAPPAIADFQALGRDFFNRVCR